MVWHDYANWGWFSKMNRVPETLHGLVQTLPAVVMGGSWLAACSRAWVASAAAKQLAKGLPGEDPWATRDFRG
jgi:hypothetical protein